MINETTIRKLVDYVLLNAYSVSSSGLYNGKAGMALALFEAARYLKDESIEDEAFELLQEALLCQTENIGFENGLSGIGYVLVYLIDNQFIDADFDELFAENHKKILKGLKAIHNKKNKELFLPSLSLVYYLCALSKSKPCLKLEHLTKQLLRETDRLLVKLFSSLKEQENAYSKMDILSFFELYLKIGDFSDSRPSASLLKEYIALYQQGKIISIFNIGYYLGCIAKKQNNMQLECISKITKERGALNIYPQILSLSQRIDLLYLLQNNKDLYLHEIKNLEKGLFDMNCENILENNILCAIERKGVFAGYQSGVARFLLYYIYQDANSSNKRFTFL